MSPKRTPRCATGARHCSHIANSRRSFQHLVGMLLGAILGRALVAIAQTFSTIDTTAAGVSANGKYKGAAAIGTSMFC